MNAAPTFSSEHFHSVLWERRVSVCVSGSSPRLLHTRPEGGAYRDLLCEASGALSGGPAPSSASRPLGEVEAAAEDHPEQQERADRTERGRLPARECER